MRVLSKAYLFHQADEIVEETLLNNLTIFPRRHRAELDLEALIGWWNNFAVCSLHRPFHGAGEFSDGARVVSLPE